jgi:hypothetical protein
MKVARKGVGERRMRPRLRSSVVVLALASAVGVAGATADGHAGIVARPIVVAAPRFTYLPPRWRAFDRDVGFLTRRGADVNSYALSWPYKPGPFGWANSMPRGAIAVNVILIRRELPGTTTANLCGHAPRFPGYPQIQLGRRPRSGAGAPGRRGPGRRGE